MTRKNRPFKLPQLGYFRAPKPDMASSTDPTGYIEHYLEVFNMDIALYVAFLNPFYLLENSHEFPPTFVYFCTVFVCLKLSEHSLVSHATF